MDAQEPSPPGPLTLDESDKARLLHVTCQAVTAAVEGRPMAIGPAELGPLAAVPVVGIFVTLRKEGQLRGCIGNFAEASRLDSALERAARGSATHDPRFPPVTGDELGQLTVEVSLLHSRQLLGSSADERVANLIVGRHGLDIQYGGRAGLLLPSVATRLGCDAAGFLAEVCRKAGLPPTAWRAADAKIYRFEATCVDGPLRI